MTQETLTSAPFAREIKLLLQVALAIFIFTVVVGILNGTDLVDFKGAQGRQVLLTHVHGGTLGWITLSVLAASLWLFGRGSVDGQMLAAGRWLSYAAAALVPLYMVAFLTTTNITRPLAGAAVMLVFIAFLAWVALRARDIELTVPHLGVLAAVASSAVGAVLGVLWGIQIARDQQIFPEGGEDAHPALMVVGFLVPVSMAVTEWALRSGRLPPPGRAGYLQIGLPFIGGLLLMFGLLLDALPLIMLNLPFEVIGVGIYVWRMWPDLRQIRWIGGSYERLCAISVVALAIDIGFLVYLIMRYEGDFDVIPLGQVLTLDHILFIGVMTNTIFALMAVAARERAALWSWADHVILVGINVGLMGFIAGLLAGEALPKQIFTPVLGFSILLGIAVYTARLQTRTPSIAAEAPAS